MSPVAPPSPGSDGIPQDVVDMLVAASRWKGAVAGVPVPPGSVLSDRKVDPAATHALVMGKFYPPHAGHHHLIRSAQSQADQVSVVVLVSSGETLSLNDRIRMLQSEHPHVRVVGTMDDFAVDYLSPEAWNNHDGLIRALVPERIDVVVTSEHYGRVLAGRYGARSVALDLPRSLYPVSGSSVRTDLSRQWGFLSPSVKAHYARRVVVVGAESTGTTTLAQDLAGSLQTLWVPEYGHEYCFAKLNANAMDVWDSSEFELIARTQERNIAAVAGACPLPCVVADTDAFATTLWHERYMGHISEKVEAIAREHPGDLYVLTLPEGVPFVQDGTRDGEHLRESMTESFRERLLAENLTSVEVSGSRLERLEAALERVRELEGDTFSFAPPLG